MCDGVSSPSWMISCARSVSQAWMPRSLERLVEPGLLGRQRLGLDDLGRRRARRSGRRRSGCTRSPSRAQCTTPAGPAHRRLELEQCSSRWRRTRSLIARPASRSSSQSASSATTSARLARIVCVAWPRLRRSCVSASAVRAACGNGIAGTAGRSSAGRRARRRASLGRGQDLGDVHRAHAGPLARERAADMHQAGVVGAAHTSAPVSRIARTLSVSIAIEVSAFLIANVPPKPQHSLGLGQLHAGRCP